MRKETPLFPPVPAGLSKSITEPSAEFKKAILKVSAVVLLFLLIYLLLIIAAIALAVASALGGIYLICAYPQFITILIGAGMVGLGVMVVCFIIKSIFSRKREHARPLTEITEEEQPVLFEFIRKTAEETGTSLPKKVFLMPDVNASAAYDSSFLSQFFPVRKNLNIGLGLVNTLNVSEFKAVIAHEFGHFSQRSMTFGTYIYHLNKVIYNILYDNDGYNNTLEAWARLHNAFAVFAVITARIISGIQWVMHKLYPLVNKSYMGLSRQMEFHADAVAASVTGSEHLVYALYKIQLADGCYNSLLNYCDTLLKNNQRPGNLYAGHRMFMHVHGKNMGAEFRDGVLQMDLSYIKNAGTERIVVKDQWASHPSTREREQRLMALDIKAVTATEPAWSLFCNAEEYQQQLTGDIYQDVTFSGKPELLEDQSFEEKYAVYTKDNDYQPVYKGYYNYRNIAAFDPDSVQEGNDEHGSFSELFSEERSTLPKKIENIRSDISTLEAIRSGEAGIKSFDFEGRKCKSEAAGPLLSQLKEELAAAEQELVLSDKRIFSFFYHLALNKGRAEELRSAYLRIFQAAERAGIYTDHYREMEALLSPLYTKLSFDDIEVQVSFIKQKERALKVPLQDLAAGIADIPDYARCRELIDTYLEKDLIYFERQRYDNGALGKLTDALSAMLEIVSSQSFNVNKACYQLQLEFLSETETEMPQMQAG